MQVKQHALARPTTYYSETKQMFKGMLDLLPIESWLALHDEWKKTNRHAVDLVMAIENDKVEFDFLHEEGTWPGDLAPWAATEHHADCLVIRRADGILQCETCLQRLQGDEE